jgi:hypothetical protein
LAAEFLAPEVRSSGDPIAFAAETGFVPDAQQTAVLQAMADPSVKH